MTPVSAWFESNGDVVQLVYGLSIAAIGAAILFQPKKGSHFALARILWLFAGYALLHAPADLIHMRSLSMGVSPRVMLVAKFLTFASYLCLFEFGRRMVGLSRSGPKAWLLPVLVGYILVLSAASGTALQTADVLFGYLIRLPAGVMAGVGLYLYYYDREDVLAPMDVKRYFMGIGGALLAWAFFCGAVRGYAPFFPANLLNKTSFFEVVTIPVYVFRTACAIVCVWGVSGVLQIFNYETVNELARHRERLEEQVVERTAELHEKHQTLSLLNQLLGLSMKNDSLRAVLEHCLAAIAAVPWLSIESNACLLLYNESHDRLELAASTGQDKACRLRDLGHCCCQESGALEAIGRPTGDGNGRFTEMGEHEHFCVPLKHGDALLGLLSIALDENREPGTREKEVLNSVAQVLANVIWRHKTEGALRQTELTYQEQLRSMASSLALAEEAERRQVAVGLHDQIGQTLALAQMKLRTASVDLADHGASAPLGDLHKLLEQVIAETRSLTFELSPPILYELGFEAAVEWLVDRAETRHDLEVTFLDDGAPKPLSQDVSVLLFRAIRELVFNVAKHAEATRLQVTVSRAGDDLVVEVIDDGVGFEPARLEMRSEGDRTFGLFSIRERMRQIGGRFRIDSAARFGTVATLVAPVHEQSGQIDIESLDPGHLLRDGAIQ